MSGCGNLNTPLWLNKGLDAELRGKCNSDPSVHLVCSGAVIKVKLCNLTDHARHQSLPAASTYTGVGRHWRIIRHSRRGNVVFDTQSFGQKMG